MIKIVVDSASELMWVSTMIDCGVINCSGSVKTIEEQYNGFKRNQNVTYVQPETYIDDLTEKENSND